MTPKQPATAADHRRFIPDDMKPNDAYILGQRDRYRRDREPDIKCRNCGQPWAIEAEAPAPTPAEPLDLMRLAVEKGCPPDALMDSSPAGQNLRNWWLNDWAPVRERMRDYLDRLAAARPEAER